MTGQARAARSIDSLFTPAKPRVGMTAVDYERAAEILRERGWTQGLGEDHAGNVCAAGAAVWAVVERLGTENVAIDQRDMAVDMGLGPTWVQLWNDAPGRTQAEVIDRLELTAKKLRNEGR